MVAKFFGSVGFDVGGMGGEGESSSIIPVVLLFELGRRVVRRGEEGAWGFHCQEQKLDFAVEQTN